MEPFLDLSLPINDTSSSSGGGFRDHKSSSKPISPVSKKNEASTNKKGIKRSDNKPGKQSKNERNNEKENKDKVVEDFLVNDTGNNGKMSKHQQKKLKAESKKSKVY